MSGPMVLREVDARGIATLTLNRPALNNAYNREMISALADGLAALREDAAVRLVILR